LTAVLHFYSVFILLQRRFHIYLKLCVIAHYVHGTGTSRIKQTSFFQTLTKSYKTTLYISRAANSDVSNFKVRKIIFFMLPYISQGRVQLTNNLDEISRCFNGSFVMLLNPLCWVAIATVSRSDYVPL